MSYTSFQVGEKFPLPIKAQGDGGLFQYDINGAMFILKLSKVDLIAIEAFRTGKIELGLFVANDIIFLLYKIDGIINGWGDSPYSVHFHTEEQLPKLADVKGKTISLYLVDSHLDILLAMRTITLPDAFFDKLIESTKDQLAKPFNKDQYIANIQSVWSKYTSEAMFEHAIARHQTEIEIAAKAPIQ
ncbi:MAG: hypothetical protein H6Q70_3063 [Firmicutes bacterium]|nr:hypothetical protein [Bacillota bacterium]